MCERGGGGKGGIGGGGELISGITVLRTVGIRYTQKGGDQCARCQQIYTENPMSIVPKKNSGHIVFSVLLR